MGQADIGRAAIIVTPRRNKRGRNVGVQADADQAGLLCYAERIGLVGRREALLVLHVRDFLQAPGFAVEAPAVITALDPAVIADATQGKRRAAMRTAILHRAGNSLIVAPQHDRLVSDIDR